MKRAWLWMALATLPIGCDRPAPQLPYKTGYLGADARCAHPSPGAPTAGCQPLVPPKPAPPKPKPVSMKGVVQMVVSIPQQKLYAFRDGQLIATSRVSTAQ